MLPLSILLAVLVAQTTPQIRPYELKGFTLGVSTLSEFKTQFHHCADVCSDADQKKYKTGAKFAPFCSDVDPGAVRPLGADADASTRAGLVFCQPYFPFEQFRGQSFTIADIQTSAYFDFFHERLYRISAAFPNYGGSNFKSMLESLTGKYGTPTSKEAREYQNGFGAKFTGLIVVWDNSVSRIELYEIGADKDTSAVEFMHTELKKEADSAAPKKNSKDL